MLASSIQSSKVQPLNPTHPLFFSTIVQPGHRAIKFNKISGVGNEVKREGWNFMIPWFEHPIIYDV